MIKEHARMAYDAISTSKIRSTMTMFGVIISVASVVTIVGLGDGLRTQVSNQITKLGSNLIIVQAGRPADSAVNLQSLQSVKGASTSVITEQDLSAVSKLPNIEKLSPVATITGLPRFEDKTMQNAVIVGASESLPEIVDKKIEYGSFFGKEDLSKNYAVIGRGVAGQLFNENVPIGKIFKIRDSEFIVQGVFEQTPVTPLSPSVNFNNAIVLPYIKAKEISAGSLQISQLLVVATSADLTQSVADAIHKTLLVSHGGQEDFSVLRQEEVLKISDGVFNQLTLFIGGAAVIALIVGGIGIMNIMFATVSERTREIGIRKAIGATNKQIMGQFITEAVLLSAIGGVLGLASSLIVIAGIRATTSLEPTLVLPVMGGAFLVSVGVGVISGILPALKAAKKDPIDSLRGV